MDFLALFAGSVKIEEINDRPEWMGRGIRMTKGKTKELAYYLFFSLMIFAKGIGLDSGDRLYYILSGAACLCVGVKLVLTKYKKREIAAVVLLCAIAFAAYRNSGRLGIVLSVLTIVGLKDMDVRKLFRLGTVVYTGSFIFTVAAAKLGIIGNPLVVHEKGGMELIRWGMGYSTGNVFHISYFMLTVLLCYTWGSRYDLKRLLGLMAGNLLVYLYSLSYTGVTVTAFYLLLNFYAVKRKRLSMAERIICQLPLPFCLLFSFGAPFLLQYPAVQRLDALLQARLTFSAYYLQNQPFTLLGARMKDVPYFWVIMDNGYVYFFMTFGAAAFVLFCAGYAVVIGRCSGLVEWAAGRKKEAGRGYQEEKRGSEKLPELAMIFSFLLYGIMEQFISNAFMNFSLLFFGEVLFGRANGDGSGEETGEEERKVSGRKVSVAAVLTGGVTGAVIFAVYFLAAPAKEYVSVPIRALNYVQAQSMQISVLNEGNSKDGLKEKMAAYGMALENREYLGRAIREAGVEDRLSEEELEAAMEYSIPVYVQGSGNYDTFRIRLLELYHDITEEEYAVLLDRMTACVQEAQEGEYFVREGIYGERIWKSAGEDRMEHMNLDKGYMVEKAGSVPGMEHIRDSVLYAVLGGAVIALWFDLRIGR